MMLACLRSRVVSRSLTLHCRWSSTLVIAEPLTGDGSVAPATCSAVTAAGQLGDAVTLLVVGDKAPTAAPKVSKIIHASVSAQPTPETVASTIQAALGDHDIVLGTSTKFGATVIPRAAALLDASPVTDIIKIEAQGAKLNEAWSENAETTSHSVPQILTFDPCTRAMPWPRSNRPSRG